MLLTDLAPNVLVIRNCFQSLYEIRKYSSVYNEPMTLIHVRVRLARPALAQLVRYSCGWGAGHFGHKTLRHRVNSAPLNWCRSLSRITGGAASHRNCPGSKCPGFSSITALVSKCLVPRFWCRSILSSVPKSPRVF